MSLVSGRLGETTFIRFDHFRVVGDEVGGGGNPEETVVPAMDDFVDAGWIGSHRVHRSGSGSRGPLRCAGVWVHVDSGVSDKGVSSWDVGTNGFLPYFDFGGSMVRFESDLGKHRAKELRWLGVVGKVQALGSFRFVVRCGAAAGQRGQCPDACVGGFGPGQDVGRDPLAVKLGHCWDWAHAVELGCEVVLWKGLGEAGEGGRRVLHDAETGRHHVPQLGLVGNIVALAAGLLWCGVDESLVPLEEPLPLPKVALRGVKKVVERVGVWFPCRGGAFGSGRRFADPARFSLGAHGLH